MHSINKKTPKIISIRLKDIINEIATITPQIGPYIILLSQPIIVPANKAI